MQTLLSQRSGRNDKVCQFAGCPPEAPGESRRSILAMLRQTPMNTISERTITSQGMPITFYTVNGMSRIEINNKLHYIGDQLLKLRMQQQHLVEMRDQLDRQNDMREMGDLFDEMFGG